MQYFSMLASAQAWGSPLIVLCRSPRTSACCEVFSQRYAGRQLLLFGRCGSVCESSLCRAHRCVFDAQQVNRVDGVSF